MPNVCFDFLKQNSKVLCEGLYPDPSGDHCIVDNHHQHPKTDCYRRATCGEKTASFAKLFFLSIPTLLAAGCEWLVRKIFCCSGKVSTTASKASDVAGQTTFVGTYSAEAEQESTRIQKQLKSNMEAASVAAQARAGAQEEVKVAAAHAPGPQSVPFTLLVWGGPFPQLRVTATCHLNTTVGAMKAAVARSTGIAAEHIDVTYAVSQTLPAEQTLGQCYNDEGNVKNRDTLYCRIIRY